MKLVFSDEAKANLQKLQNEKAQKGILKQVLKALGYMETNLKHPSLNTHKFDDIESPLGVVFESYAQNNTPGAYRIFWVYGPGKSVITILAITPHP